MLCCGSYLVPASFSSASLISFRRLRKVGGHSFISISLSCRSIMADSTAPLLLPSYWLTETNHLFERLWSVMPPSFSGNQIKILLDNGKEVRKQSTSLLQTQMIQKYFTELQYTVGCWCQGLKRAFL